MYWFAVGDRSVLSVCVCACVCLCDDDDDDVNKIISIYCTSVASEKLYIEDIAKDKHTQSTLFPFSLQLFVMVFDSNINF